MIAVFVRTEERTAFFLLHKKTKPAIMLRKLSVRYYIFFVSQPSSDRVKRMVSQMYLTVNGIKLYYEKTGSGKPLIMSHCNSMDHRIFKKAAKLLSEKFTVYCPDTRDHGKSEKVGVLHYEDMAEDMRCFIEELRLEKPVFYGFSDGGITGLILASEHPELLSALVVSGASLSPESTKDTPKAP